jgi:4-oxalocrotonate tautomerase
MPVINVKMAAGRSQETKQELVAALTREAAGILEIKPEWITIIIDEYPRDNWASGGELHALKFGPGFGRQGT